MSKPTYKIYPLYLGRFPAYEKSVLQMMTGYGVKVDSPAQAYLIQGDGKNILVDTGPGKEEDRAKMHPGLAIEFPEEVNIVNTLAKLGVTPADVDAIVFTHLHWDHCQDTDKFPGVPMYVQQDEVIYALNPLDMHGNVYESPKAGLIPPWWNSVTQLKIIEGDYELFDGIDLLFTPSHTPGSQCVLVNTEDGPYLLAGDCIMQYENWEGNAVLKHIYSTAHVNLMDFDKSLKRIEKLNAFILPGHDYKVFENKVYPAK